MYEYITRGYSLYGVKMLSTILIFVALSGRVRVHVVYLSQRRRSVSRDAFIRRKSRCNRANDDLSQRPGVVQAPWAVSIKRDNEANNGSALEVTVGGRAFHDALALTGQ